MPAARVYLVRHAKAEHGPADAARRLTPAGRDAFQASLGRLGPKLRVTSIRTSPFARARETADLLAAATGAPVEEDQALASGASDGRGVLALVRRARDGAALVGHNPELAEVIATVAGRDVEVKPGAIAALDVDGGEVRLSWLALP